MNLEEIYLKNSQIPKRYLQEIPLIPANKDEQTFDKLAEIKNNSINFVKAGSNILICSNRVGNGKTSWATKILKAFIHDVSGYKAPRNCPALFINVSNFLNEKKLAIGNPEMLAKVNDIEQKILTVPLVVFDDLCVKGLSEYDMSNLYYWVDTRVNNCLSTIYTSNLLPTQLEKSLDSRLFSRIYGFSKTFIIEDGDHRKC